MAVLAIAAELRCAGVAEADALAYVTGNLGLFEKGSTHGRALLRQLERSVSFAYNPPDGTAILSGCCRGLSIPFPFSPPSGSRLFQVLPGRGRGGGLPY